MTITMGLVNPMCRFLLLSKPGKSGDKFSMDALVSKGRSQSFLAASADDRHIMKEFYLLDLYHQAAYIPQYVRSWPFERLLSWLRVYGEVIMHPSSSNTFYFYAWSGFYGAFRYEADGSLFFVGDHFLSRLW